MRFITVINQLYGNEFRRCRINNASLINHDTGKSHLRGDSPDEKDY